MWCGHAGAYIVMPYIVMAQMSGVKVVWVAFASLSAWSFPYTSRYTRPATLPGAAGSSATNSASVLPDFVGCNSACDFRLPRP